MTRQVEFLFECVKDTVEEVLPEEVSDLKRYDEVWGYLNNRFDMTHKDMSLLLSFLTQGKGRFSQRAKGKEFAGIFFREINLDRLLTPKISIKWLMLTITGFHFAKPTLSELSKPHYEV
ncbi:MAG: hypothetical protein LAT53_07290 [Idiomarina sp.]|nr:hypothetical protein [Idiomarina sp.]